MVELSRDELKVVALMAEGHSFAIIATKLFMARTTVNRHAANARRKLGAVNPINTVHKAHLAGLLGNGSSSGD